MRMYRVQRNHNKFNSKNGLLAQMISVPHSQFQQIIESVLRLSSNCFLFLQIRVNTSQSIRRLWNVIMINVLSINCVNIFIAWTFYA